MTRSGTYYIRICMYVCCFIYSSPIFRCIHLDMIMHIVFLHKLIGPSRWTKNTALPLKDIVSDSLTHICVSNYYSLLVKHNTVGLQKINKQTKKTTTHPHSSTQVNICRVHERTSFCLDFAACRQ